MWNFQRVFIFQICSHGSNKKIFKFFHYLFLVKNCCENLNNKTDFLKILFSPFEVFKKVKGFELSSKNLNESWKYG